MLFLGSTAQHFDPLGGGKACCTSRGRGGVVSKLILRVRTGSFCRPSAALNPVFVLPTTVTEVFDLIYNCSYPSDFQRSMPDMETRVCLFVCLFNIHKILI